MDKSTKYLNMKSIFSSIFFLFFLLPSTSFSQIKISGTKEILMVTHSPPIAFVRKEVVVTQTMIENGPNPIIILNKINNSVTYGTKQGLTVGLESQSELEASNSNQLVIDLAEAKKEMELGNKFNASTLIDPNLVGFVFFDVNSAELRPEYALELNKLQDVLNNNPNMNIRIIGHADLKASEYGNSQIASTRAQYMLNYFTQEKGMNPDRFELSTARENFFKVPSEAHVNATNQSDKNRSVSFLLVERKKQITFSAQNNTLGAPAEPNKNSNASSAFKNYADGEVLGFVFFDYDSDKVKPEYYSELFKLNTILDNSSDTQIILVGHGDVNASEKKDLLIAKNRSESVYNFLTKIFKMDPKKLEVFYEGENNFLIPEGNSINAANKKEMNRSVTIILKQK